MASAAASAISKAVELCLSIREKLQILKETDENARFYYNLLENIGAVLDQLTDEGKVEVFVVQLDEVKEQLKDLLKGFEEPSMLEQFKLLLKQAEKARKLEAIYKKLTTCILLIILCHDPKKNEVIGQISQDISKAIDLVTVVLQNSIQQEKVDQIVDNLRIVLQAQDEKLDSICNTLKNLQLQDSDSTGHSEVDAPQPGEQMDPLRTVISPLMNHPSNYDEEFVGAVHVEGNITDSQIKEFLGDQNWREDLKRRFIEEQRRLQQFDNIQTVSVHIVLKSWALIIQGIYGKNPEYSEVEKRKHVWKMMTHLRSHQPTLFKKLMDGNIFPGGVLGINPEIASKRVNQLRYDRSKKLKRLLQQELENDWRALAGKIPRVEQLDIDLWKQSGHEKAVEKTLTAYSTSERGTAQHLYEDLIDLERYDVAQILEK